MGRAIQQFQTIILYGANNETYSNILPSNPPDCNFKVIAGVACSSIAWLTKCVLPKKMELGNGTSAQKRARSPFGKPIYGFVGIATPKASARLRHITSQAFVPKIRECGGGQSCCVKIITAIFSRRRSHQWSSQSFGQTCAVKPRVSHACLLPTKARNKF